MIRVLIYVSVVPLETPAVTMNNAMLIYHAESKAYGHTQLLVNQEVRSDQTVKQITIAKLGTSAGNYLQQKTKFASKNIMRHMGLNFSGTA